jgi:hypothetical protein
VSFSYTNAVWGGFPEIKGGERLVLLSLADRANDHGKCWPSIRDIATRTQVSERQVKRLLRSLEKRGVLKKDLQAGMNGVNMYTLSISVQGVTPMTRGGDIHAPPGGTLMTPKPSKNHQRTKYINEGVKEYALTNRSDLERKLASAF